jgi:hypothetical protein
MIQTTDQLFNYYKEYVALTEGHYDYLIDKEDFKKALKEFATLHVKQALLEASNKAKIKYNYSSNTDFEYCDEFVDPESILNAYNIEENIK